jgi:hypothetical protein
VKICYNANAAVSTVRVDGESRDIEVMTDLVVEVIRRMSEVTQRSSADFGMDTAGYSRTVYV